MDINPNKIIIEVRAGAGGDEAGIFANDLVTMYQRYAHKRGWRFTEMDASKNERGGYKSFVGRIEGEGVYEDLKMESGVHRVQRVPATERAGRVHTSTASVAILPQVEQTQVDINPADLEISFFRSSGPGGQNVNKVETAVRITHKPTGVVVSAQSERSQSANREVAMGMLRSQLYTAMKEQQAASLGELRRDQIGSMERSEKIRTWNFPDDRITDHRMGKKFHNIEGILAGDMDKIVKTAHEQQKSDH